MGMKIFMSGIYYPDALTTGIVRHTYNLYHHLKKNNNVEIMYFYPFDNVKYGIRYSIPYPYTFMFPEIARVFATKIALKQKADIYYADYPTSAFPLIMAMKKPLVVTFHDVNPIVHPEWQPAISNEWAKLCYKIVENANKIIFDSDFAKQDALQYTKIPESKIEVIYVGIDNKFRPVHTTDKKTFTIGYIGGYAKHKNTDIIFELAKSLPDFKFKLCGVSQRHKEITEKANSISNIELLGYIPEEKMVEMYNSFDAFIFPSLYEGFGLPPLEAMKCGVPTVVMNNASLPEVVGNGAIVVNNKEEMQDVILSLYSSDTLRKKYSKLGIERSKQFTWDKTILYYREIFEKEKRRG